MLVRLACLLIIRLFGWLALLARSDAASSRTTSATSGPHRAQQDRGRVLEPHRVRTVRSECTDRMLIYG